MRFFFFNFEGDFKLQSDWYVTRTVKKRFLSSTSRDEITFVARGFTEEDMKCLYPFIANADLASRSPRGWTGGDAAPALTPPKATKGIDCGKQPLCFICLVNK